MYGNPHHFLNSGMTKCKGEVSPKEYIEGRSKRFWRSYLCYMYTHFFSYIPATEDCPLKSILVV
jgi:hypothetical protein